MGVASYLAVSRGSRAARYLRAGLVPGQNRLALPCRILPVALALPTIWLSHGTGTGCNRGDAYAVYRDHRSAACRSWIVGRAVSHSIGGHVTAEISISSVTHADELVIRGPGHEVCALLCTHCLGRAQEAGGAHRRGKGAETRRGWVASRRPPRGEEEKQERRVAAQPAHSPTAVLPAHREGGLIVFLFLTAVLTFASSVPGVTERPALVHLTCAIVTRAGYQGKSKPMPRACKRPWGDTAASEETLWP